MFKTIILISLIASVCFITTREALAKTKYLPESRHYHVGETGYKKQYQTPSLHNTNQYVLTFDDGPDAKRTPIILDILKKYRMKATFFLVANRITKQTLPIIDRMIKEGHTVANHDLVHDNNNQISEQRFNQKLHKSFSKFKATFEKLNAPYDQFYFRFPYAAYGQAQGYHHLNSIREFSKEFFGDNCIHFVFWDHDSSDWVPTLTPKELLQNVKAMHLGGDYYGYKLVNVNGTREIHKVKTQITDIKGGGVILFHDIQQRTVDALDSILAFFREQKSSIIPLGQVKEYHRSDFDKCLSN